MKNLENWENWGREQEKRGRGKWLQEQEKRGRGKWLRCCIFDMDGLMFDTENLSNQAFYDTADELGIVVDPRMLQEMKGVNKAGCTRIQREYLGEDFDVEYARMVRGKYIDAYIMEHGVPVKKGLEELLHFLKENGYVIVLATSTDEKKARFNLENAGVIRFFDHMVFGNMVQRSKPAPDIFLKAVELSGCSAQECLVLEDSYNGIEAGYAAGCHVVMVPDCLPPNERMEEVTDMILPDLVAVKAWLE